MSDHTPLLLATNAAFHPKRRFHFENYWIKIPGYLNAVERGWTCGQTIVDPFGCLDQELRNTMRVLQSWSQSSVRQIRDQQLAARVIIRQFDRAEEHRTLEDRKRTFITSSKCWCSALSVF
jgi:hypothetical protein